jgi:hypothetical protein
MNNIYNILLNTLKKIDNVKSFVYILFFLFYFIFYYIITIIESLKETQNNFLYYLFRILFFNKIAFYTIITFDILYLVYLVYILYYSFTKINNETSNIIKLKLILPAIFITALIVFLNVLTFTIFLFVISNNIVIKIIYEILANIFYVMFLLLFIFNINEPINIELFIAVEILLLFTIQNIILCSSNIYRTHANLQKDDFSLLTVNCTSKISTENFSSVNNIQLNDISKKYGSTYLKTMGNIPIAFFNKNINDYQDLVLADFYYPGSYYSYLSTTPLNGIPNLEALKICINDYKSRIIHIDIFSDNPNEYDPNSNPVVRCKNMKLGSEALNFDDVLNLINKYAWLNDDPNNLSYPFFIYMNCNFNPTNQSIFIKMYKSILKIFSKYLMNKKYGFCERNSKYPISMAPMKECIGKIVLICNIYPTKTVLDELINTSTNDLSNSFKINVYKENYVKYEKVGISQDNDKTKLLNNSKTNFSFYYTEPNEKYKNDNQMKAGLYNPSFQDIAQYGIQGTLMYMFITDDNFKNWLLFFKSKNNLNPVLKDEILRYVINEIPTINKLKPIEGLQKPQKYCIVPGLLDTEKSNITEGTQNNSCK